MLDWLLSAQILLQVPGVIKKYTAKYVGYRKYIPVLKSIPEYDRVRIFRIRGTL